MTERPILFSTGMVKAIDRGKKTMTRRVIKPQPPLKWNQCKAIKSDYAGIIGWDFYNSADPYDHGYLKKSFPYGNVGDKLWVREAWGSDNWEYINEYKKEPWRGLPDINTADIYYKASENCEDIFLKGYWKPSIHMPRWASRILLEIENIRVEKIQEISNEDALKEGIVLRGTTRYVDEAKNEFRLLWDSINEKRGFEWTKNPWVWVIEFKKIDHI